MSVRLFTCLFFLLLSVSSLFSMMQFNELPLSRNTNEEATDVSEYTQGQKNHKRLKAGAYKVLQ